MHLHHDHIGSGAHAHEHEHTHSHEHTHGGVTHSHDHVHAHEHDHEHCHEHGEGHECGGHCGSCGHHEHTPMEELVALMKYMAGHNASHANELAALAKQLQQAGQAMAYEQVMAAVSDYEKGNMRLSAVLAALEVK